MNLKKLVSGLLLSTALAAGVGVSITSQKSSAKEVKAASTIDIYCTRSNNFTFLADSIQVHQWGGTTPDTTWPGPNMTKVFDNENGEHVFKLSIPSDRTGLIFSSLEGSTRKQTADVTTNIQNNQGWYFSGWSGDKMTVGTWTVKPYTINYYGNNSTSGSMASETGYANVAWGLTTNSYSRTNYEFTGWNTSADGSGTPYTNGALIAKDSTFTNNTLNLYAQWRRVYASGRYITGTFPAGTSDDWAVSGSILMSGTGTEGEYSGTVTLAYGDMLKTPYYNGSSFEYVLAYDSYQSMYPGAQAGYCFGDNGGDNHEIKCYAAGLYTFYFKDSAYDEGGHKISVAYNGALTAQHLAAKLMNFMEYEGHCGDNDRFPAMRTIYLGLSESEQTVFQGYASSGTDQFRNAYNRYTAWARALGENPWANAKANSRIVLSSITGGNTSSTLVIVAISAVSLAAVGGYFLFRKKKEN